MIGQGCEFDYSGVQACKALRREGYRIVLVNSNPATIMTDPEFADATYVEPLTVDILEKIIAVRAAGRAAADGGRADRRSIWRWICSGPGVLDRYGVQLIGAQAARHRAGRGPAEVQASHDWRPGLAVPESGLARSLAEAAGAGRTAGLPMPDPAVVHAGRQRRRRGPRRRARCS